MQNQPSGAIEPEFDTAHFRNALSQFATGVTVITTRLEDGTFVGLTASSFNSVSLRPPLVLWSLSQRRQHAAGVYRQFALRDQRAVRRPGPTWPSSSRAAAPTASTAFRYTLSRTGLPVLDGVAAWFECHNRSRYPEGDHVIFVGEVEQCEVNPQPGLVFHGGRLMDSGGR